MKLLIGFCIIFVSCTWLFWMSKRGRQPTSLKQALIDFVTGSSSEGVLSIGLLLFSLLLITAHLLNCE